MPKSINRVKSKKPEFLDDPGLIAMTDDIDTYESIEITANSEGGQIIINNLKSDILSAIKALSQYKKATHAELIAICATVNERLNVYQMMTNAKKNKKLALDELEKILDA